MKRENFTAILRKAGGVQNWVPFAKFQDQWNEELGQTSASHIHDEIKKFQKLGFIKISSQSEIEKVHSIRLKLLPGFLMNVKGQDGKKAFQVWSINWELLGEFKSKSAAKKLLKKCALLSKAKKASSTNRSNKQLVTSSNAGTVPKTRKSIQIKKQPSVSSPGVQGSTSSGASKLENLDRAPRASSSSPSKSQTAPNKPSRTSAPKRVRKVAEKVRGKDKMSSHRQSNLAPMPRNIPATSQTVTIAQKINSNSPSPIRQALFSKNTAKSKIDNLTNVIRPSIDTINKQSMPPSGSQPPEKETLVEQNTDIKTLELEDSGRPECSLELDAQKHEKPCWPQSSDPARQDKLVSKEETKSNQTIEASTQNGKPISSSNIETKSSFSKSVLVPTKKLTKSYLSVSSKHTPNPNPKTAGESCKSKRRIQNSKSEYINKTNSPHKRQEYIEDVLKSKVTDKISPSSSEKTFVIDSNTTSSGSVADGKENMVVEDEESWEEDATSKTQSTRSVSPSVSQRKSSQPVVLCESGTPMMRDILQNHKLLVDYHSNSVNKLEDFETILVTHLSHNLDFMDIEELEWNNSALTSLADEFRLSQDSHKLVEIILRQMIELRKNCRPLFKSLVDSANRQRDQKMIEREHGLAEQGLLDLRIYSKAKPDLLIATGYYRMLYGDHGPYIEFIRKQINWESFPINDRRGRNAYFDYCYSKDRTIRLYHQRRDVRNKPNPPHLFGALRADHNRPEGYADYVTGRYYADASDVLVKRDTYISLLRKIRRARRR